MAWLFLKSPLSGTHIICSVSFNLSGVCSELALLAVVSASHETLFFYYILDKLSTPLRFFPKGTNFLMCVSFVCLPCIACFLQSLRFFSFPFSFFEFFFRVSDCNFNSISLFLPDLNLTFICLWTWFFSPTSFLGAFSLFAAFPCLISSAFVRSS